MTQTAVYLQVYFSRTGDINMVGNHFDSVGRSFCDDLKSSSVKTSLLAEVSMEARAFLRSVGGKVRPVVLRVIKSE